MSRRRLVVLLLVVLVPVLGTIAALTYRVFFMRLIRVPQGAMMNTILPGDHLIVHRLLGDISRGDIVVFTYPNDEASYVARVVGLPGETIQLKGKLVYINDRVLDEQRVLVASDNDYGPLEELSTEGTGPYRVYYIKHSSEEGEAPADALGDIGTVTPFQVPADSYFLIGDNRENSYDSRYRGAVPRNLIWGKCSMIYYSVTEPSREEVRWDRVFKKVQ
ncbi:MAG TPA: signal peptidase I [Pyrinomonadaceae bacterium]|nr:signal peptidase I [Pyrinomonadaceae bacterium]